MWVTDIIDYFCAIKADSIGEVVVVGNKLLSRFDVFLVGGYFVWK